MRRWPRPPRRAADNLTRFLPQHVFLTVLTLIQDYVLCPCPAPIPRGVSRLTNAGRDAGVPGPRAGDAARLRFRRSKPRPSRLCRPHATGAPAMSRLLGSMADPNVAARAPQRWIGVLPKWGQGTPERVTPPGAAGKRRRAPARGTPVESWRTCGFRTSACLDAARHRGPWVLSDPGVPRALGLVWGGGKPPALRLKRRRKD